VGAVRGKREKGEEKGWKTGGRGGNDKRGGERIREVGGEIGGR